MSRTVRCFLPPNISTFDVDRLAKALDEGSHVRGVQ